MDSTVFERYGQQEGSLKGHNPRRHGRPSHHPLLAVLGEAHFLLHGARIIRWMGRMRWRPRGLQVRDVYLGKAARRGRIHRIDDALNMWTDVRPLLLAENDHGDFSFS